MFTRYIDILSIPERKYSGSQLIHLLSAGVLKMADFEKLLLASADLYGGLLRDLKAQHD